MTLNNISILNRSLFFAVALLIFSINTDASDKKQGLTNPKSKPSPRSNFYESVNHEWLKNTEIPADKPGINNFIFIRDQVNREISELLSILDKKEKPTASDEKIKQIYNSYIDMDARNAKGIAPLIPVLSKIESAKSHDDIILLFADLQKLGVMSPFVMASGSDFKNSDQVIVLVSQSGLGMERESYIQEDDRSKLQRKFYQDFLQELFTLASLTEPDIKAASVLALEKSLAEIQWSKTENRDLGKIYNVTDFSGLKKNSGNLNLDNYLKELDYPNNYPINVMQPRYMSSFNQLFPSKDLESWKSYLKGQLLISFSKLLDSKFQQAAVKYEMNLGLYKQEEPVKTQAVNYLNENVGMLLGKTFIENRFDKKIKTKLKEVIKNITDEYRIAFRESKRMGTRTKKKAIEKLNSITFMIGYPDEWQDYSSLELKTGELVLNHQNIQIYEHKRGLAKLGKPADKKEWGRPPQDINAFYSPLSNSFVLLAGILYPPFFNLNANDAQMYGGIGFVIGHEIGHAFDDQGSRFDAKGNMINWWSEEDAKEFNKIKSALIKQANSYEILPGKYLKGELEIGEIIGDLSGAEISLRAFQKIIKAKKLNAKQGYRDYFNQLAITWRDKLRDDYKLLLLDKDVHPPSEFRSNGIVKNFDEFHSVFKTKPGDGMYLPPEQRIKMWSTEPKF